MATSVGVEIGATSVRAVRLQPEGRSLRPSPGTRLLASTSAPLRGTTEGDLVEALVQVRKALGIRQPVILGVPTTTSIVTTVEPLVVNRARAWLAVQFELQQQVPYDMQQAVWDYSPPVSLRETSRRDFVVVLAMKQSLLAWYLAACKRAGLSVGAVSVGAIAVVNAWLRAHGADEPAKQPAVLLHLDEELLEWIVVNGHRVQVVPMVLSAAERLAGEALAGLVQGSWESVRELAGPGGSSARVWLLGESAVRPALGQALTQACACTVDVIDPTRLVNLEPSRPASPERLLGACGLALQGLGRAAIAVNVLTQTRRRQRLTRWRRAARLASGLALAVLIWCGAGAMLTVLRARQGVLQALLAQEQTYTQLRPEAQALLKQQRQLEDRLGQLKQLMDTRAVLITAFRQIAEALPDEIWLTKLELSSRETTEAMIEGYAKSFQGMNRLMEQVKASGQWASAKPIATTVTTDATTNQQLIAFTVQAQQ